MIRLALRLATLFAVTLFLLPAAPVGGHVLPGFSDHPAPVAGGSSTPVSNLTASVNRVVQLLGVCGGGLLAVVWARVAVSWFSHDLSKKIQAKERARDALIGTLLFTAALTGLIWGLAHWVLTGT
jgi:hypothetical protein